MRQRRGRGGGRTHTSSVHRTDRSLKPSDSLVPHLDLPSGRPKLLLRDRDGVMQPVVLRRNVLGARVQVDRVLRAVGRSEMHPATTGRTTGRASICSGGAHRLPLLCPCLPGRLQIGPSLPLRRARRPPVGSPLVQQPILKRRKRLLMLTLLLLVGHANALLPSLVDPRLPLDHPVAQRRGLGRSMRCLATQLLGFKRRRRCGVGCGREGGGGVVSGGVAVATRGRGRARSRALG